MSLDEKLSDQIIALSNEAFAVEQTGELKAASKLLNKTWDMLPEPKQSHDLSMHIARSLVQFYFRQKKYDRAIEWVAVAMQCPIPEIDTSMDILAGQVYFESGDIDQAKVYLKRAYDKGKKRAFQGIDAKYLKFLMSEI